VTWPEVLLRLGAEVGGLAVIVAGIAWLARKLIAQGLAKEMEVFKAQLRVEAERKQTTFAHLHARRAEVIAEVYAGMDRTYKAAHSLAKPFESGAEDPKPVKLDALAAIGNELRTHFDENRIYFSADLCEGFDRFFRAIKEAADKWAVPADSSIPTRQWLESWNAIKDEVPPLRAELESEFRILLGVESGS